MARPEHAAAEGRDPLVERDPFEIELPYDVHPARFVRQVIGMFLAVQDSHILLSDHPRLATLIDVDTDRAERRRHAGHEIAPLHLAMAVDNGPYAYLMTPAMAVSVPLTDQRHGLWTPPGAKSSNSSLLMMRFAPFAFFLTDAQPHPGLNITEWTTWDVDQRPRRANRRLQIRTVRGIGTITAAMLHPRPADVSTSPSA